MYFLMSKPLTSLRHWGALCLWAWCTIAFADPARIVTLTPHATEMVFAAGAGQQIVGTVESSDFPPGAQSITRVGDGLNTSAEQVLALNPDWVVGWASPLLSQLQNLGVKTIASNPTSLQAIGQEVLRLGELFETSARARAWHSQFEQAAHELGNPDISPPVNVVILASSDAQFVIGRDALINDTLKRCGATNPFAATQAAAPQISRESLIAAKPDVMISGRQFDGSQPMTLTVPLAVIDADSLYRPGPRFIEAARTICTLVRAAQQERTAHTTHTTRTTP